MKALEIVKKYTSVNEVAQDRMCDQMKNAIIDLEKDQEELIRLRELEKEIKAYFETEGKIDNNITVMNIVHKRMIMQILKEGDQHEK